MTKNLSQKAAVLNPALEPFGKLVGEWETSGTHPYLPDKILHGRSSFTWVEEGAFLMWKSEVDDEHFPTGIAIFGSDDATGEYFMLYFDDRKVSRMYNVSVQENVLKWWRDAPGFSQRYSWTFKDKGSVIIGNGELSRDGKTWEKDLESTFKRVM